MTKTEQLKEELVTEYGFRKADFVREDGKNLTFKELESMLKKAKAKKAEVEKEEADSLDLFDGEVIKNSEILRKFNEDDKIQVMSGINGELIYRSQINGGQFKFTKFGQVQTMPYKELVSMNNIAHSVLDKGWIIILNKDIIKEFGLEEDYQHFLTPAKIDSILNMDSKDLAEAIRELPRSMRVTLFDVAKTRYNIGTFDSSARIKVFEEEYKISFDDNLPIGDTIVTK